MEILVFGIVAAVPYRYETEVFLSLGSAYVTCRFLYKWYMPLFETWPPEHGETGRRVLGCFLSVSLTTILFILLTMASYDVAGIWAVSYILMGYVQICGGAFMMECLGSSWPSDAVHLDNKAAVFPAAGGFVGVTLIYVGANTGGRPGWRVVLFAARLGLITWLGPALVINLLIDMSERVSVDRNMGSGIRLGAYLIANSLILAYTSGGGWTFTQATLMEFSIGWPVLPPMLSSLAVEWLYIRPSRPLVDNRLQANILPSVLWRVIYLVYTGIVLLIFRRISERISGGVLL